MRIETERLVIRDLERKDQEQLYKIVWQKNVVRFMRDWSENSPSPESFDGYVDWHQTQKDSIDVYECKRYAITLKNVDILIGTVGMGFEDTVCELDTTRDVLRVSYYVCRSKHITGCFLCQQGFEK